MKNLTINRGKPCPTCGAPNGSSSAEHSDTCNRTGWSKAYDLAMIHTAKLNRSIHGSSLAQVLIDLVSKEGCADPEVVLATLHGCPKELR